MNIYLYSSDHREEWDEFVNQAKNSHFMFHRDYVEYHSDRFFDFSIMVRNDKGNIIAIMPANLSNRTLYSHQGLTFGGLCIGKSATTETVLDIFELLIDYLKGTKLIDDLIYKRLPDFYTNYPSQEDLYALFKLKAVLYRRDVSAAIDLDQPLPIISKKIRYIRKAIKNDITISKEKNLVEFWELLTHVLLLQHGINPTHTLNEINFLIQKFPDNIKCFSAKKDSIIVAGVLIFETENVVHTQYIANGLLGRRLGGLDLLISELIKKYSGVKKYFDFGISTEKAGTLLNKGLISQKEGFGARAYVQDFFRLSLK